MSDGHGIMMPIPPTEYRLRLRVVCDAKPGVVAPGFTCQETGLTQLVRAATTSGLHLAYLHPPVMREIRVYHVHSYKMRLVTLCFTSKVLTDCCQLRKEFPSVC